VTQIQNSHSIFVTTPDVSFSSLVIEGVKMEERNGITVFSTNGKAIAYFSPSLRTIMLPLEDRGTYIISRLNLLLSFCCEEQLKTIGSELYLWKPSL
jgi:hypothetical protein